MAKAMKIKDLASDDVQKQSDADLTGIIAKGKKPMPAYEGKLTPEQIAGIVKYIRALKKEAGSRGGWARPTHLPGLSHLSGKIWNPPKRHRVA